MNDMYNKAKLAWGLAMPKQIKALQNRDDDHVACALVAVLNDIMSDTWTIDARIAWRILQGRNEE